MADYALADYARMEKFAQYGGRRGGPVARYTGSDPGRWRGWAPIPAATLPDDGAAGAGGYLDVAAGPDAADFDDLDLGLFGCAAGDASWLAEAPSPPTPPPPGPSGRRMCKGLALRVRV